MVSQSYEKVRTLLVIRFGGRATLVAQNFHVGTAGVTALEHGAIGLHLRRA